MPYLMLQKLGTFQFKYREKTVLIIDAEPRWAMLQNGHVIATSSLKSAV